MKLILNTYNIPKIMKKISIVGIDNTGKTSIVKSLENIEEIRTIHLTAYQDYKSRIAKISGGFSNSLIQFGEKNNSKLITGFAYFLHLFPYFFEEKLKTNSSLLISDRDPIIDTLCYSEFYLSENLSKIIKPVLKPALESLFYHPSSFIYLNISPEVSAKRNNKPLQLHDQIESLTHLKNLFDEEMFFMKKNGTPVIQINTDDKSLEEVTDETRYNVRHLSK